MNAFALACSLALFVAADAPTRAVDGRSELGTVGKDCTLGGKKLHGRVKVVESFPDLKVRVVDSFPDLKVKVVDSFPDECGEWRFVDSFPDFTIAYVDSFPDLQVKHVDSFPGLP